MRRIARPQTWRLLELPRPRQCPHCGQVHQYLTHTVLGGDCQPVLFPPGSPAVPGRGNAVEVFLAGPVEGSALADDPAYRHLAAQVRERAIRCERCGERFEDLEEYRLHACELRYR